MSRLRLGILLLCCWNVSMGQELSQTEVSNLHDFFARGKVHGHVRKYWMGTLNKGELTDYWALALGGALKYETAPWKGVQLGVKGIFTYNMADSDLLKVDPLAQKSAKWEQELFDISRPGERSDLDRLEELYVSYSFKKGKLVYGKMDINKGPLLLKRDGRMKPFVYKGGWAELMPSDHQKIFAGWIHHASPRGMTDWYRLRELIGQNNNGFALNGEKASYQGHNRSLGLFLAGYEQQVSSGLSWQLWNYYLHQLFNTVWLQADWKKKNWFAGVQYVFQFADAYQNTLAAVNRIYQPDEKAQVFSAQVGYQLKEQGKISVAYWRTLNTGRFIFPKELTRESFYVSHPRSWLDGLGNSRAWMMRYRDSFLKVPNLKLDWCLAGVHIPDATDFANNKYGKSTYYQSTFGLAYHFKKWLKGAKFNLLYVFKYTPNRMSLPLKKQFYTTNLHHFNLVFNVNF